MKVTTALALTILARRVQGAIYLLLLFLLFTCGALAQTSSTTHATDGHTPAELAPGAPAGSYPLSGFDSINLFSQSLGFRLPLLRVGARGAAAYTITLPIERKWRVEHNVYTPSLSCKECDAFPPEHHYRPLSNWYTALKPGFSPGVMLVRMSGIDPESAFCGGAYTKTLARLTFVAPDGTEYELRDKLSGGAPLPVSASCTQGANRGRDFVTADGSSATFIAEADIIDHTHPATDPEGATIDVSGTLYLRDGTRYHVSHNVVDLIRDRNGNELRYYQSLPVPGQPGVYVDKAVDSAGREVVINTGTGEITYKGFAGATRTLRILYAPLQQRLRQGNAEHQVEPLQTLSQLFPSLPVNGESDAQTMSTVFNDMVVSEVELPDGRSYGFRYNSYGELARMELPTGGAFEYDYAEGDGVISTGDDYEVLRRVVRQRTYGRSGELESVTTFTGCGALPTGYVNSCVQVDELDPHADASSSCAQPVAGQNYRLVSRTRHYFYGVAGPGLFTWPTHYTKWNEGKEFRTETYACDGVTLLRRVEQQWRQRAAVSWWAGSTGVEKGPEPANDPRVVETLTTLADSGQVTKTSSLSPSDQNVVGFDLYNNPTDVWEYDYDTGSASPRPLRHTHTDYLTVSNGISYTSAATGHLRSLPSAQRVYAVDPESGAETLVARSETFYDETAYQHAPYGAVTGWTATGTTARGNATTVRRYLDMSANVSLEQSCPADKCVETHAEYDQLGNATGVWDANGNVTQSAYSAALAYAYPTSTTSAAPNPLAEHGYPAGTFGSTTGFTTFTNYDFDTGLVISRTDANAKTTTYDYSDSLDRLTRVERPDGGRTTYTYVSTGSCGDYVRTRTLLDAAGRETDAYQYYDGLGRAYLSATFDNQDATKPYLRVDTRYDSQGRVSQVSNPYRASDCTSIVNPSNRWTRSEYDALGRVVRVTTPDGAQVRTSYSGSRVLVTDQANKQRVSNSDALGRLREVWEVKAADPQHPDAALESITFPAPPDVPAVSTGYRTAYIYDVLGNLQGVKQGMQPVRSFVYDALSRLTSATNPESGTASYTYDPNGNLLTKTDARGVSASYQYDHLNRNILISYEGGGTTTPEVRRYYDNAAAGANGLGRLHSTQTIGVAATVYDSYDVMGRPTQYHQAFWVNNNWNQFFSVGRVYDKAGNVTSQTYPSGHVVAYSYDVAGRLADNGTQPAFTGNLGDGVARTYAAGTSYGEMGGIEREQFGTQVPLYHKLRYNVRGQLWNVRLSTGGDAESWNRGMLVNHYGNGDFTAGWGTSGTNNNGNILRSHHYVPVSDAADLNNPTSYSIFFEDYEYDALNRLAKVTETSKDSANVWQQQYAQAYDYDSWGNRTVNLSQSQNVPVAQYEFDKRALSSTNRLYAPGDLDYTDPQDAGRRMRYDAAGNLIYDAYTGAGARTYDAENRMTSAADSSGNAAIYTYNADGQRVKRKAAGEEWWQVYGMSGELLAEYPAGAATFLAAKEYGYRNGELLVTMSSGDVERLKRFVRNLYYNCLARDASATELQQQMDALAQAGAQGGEPQLLATARSLARGLFQSSEYVSRSRTDSQYVTDLYNAYLQRGPDAAGLNHWTQDAQTNGRGATLNAFEVSTEFATLSSTVYGTAAGGDNQRVESFVRNFYYGALGREPTSTEMADRRQRLNNAAAQGLSQVVAEAQAMGVELFQATNYNSNHSNEQYVGDLYEAFLQRAPDGPGLSYWMNNVAVNGRAATLNGFKEATEYRELAATLYRETYWLVSDHLGTPRMLADKTGSLSGIKRHDYMPFGEELFTGGRTSRQGYGTTNPTRHRFTGKEHDIETGLDYFGARYYENSQGRFTSVDPSLLSAKLTQPQSWNRYTYVLNNPLRLVDPTGAVPQESTDAHYSYFPTLKVVRFFIAHPEIATAIGQGSERFSISSAAIRFSSRTGLADNNSREGTQANAARHVMWQSIITARYGADVAMRAGNAHESSPRVDLSARRFEGGDSLVRADQTIDLLNNQIGRQIGSMNPSASYQELARMTLDFFLNVGLYTARQNASGSVTTIEQTRLTDEQYNQAINALNGLTNWGETPAENATRNAAFDEQERRRMEEVQRRMDRHPE